MMIGPSTQATVISATRQRRNVSGTAQGVEVLVVAEESANTADTALRLGRYFEIGPQLWLNLQSRYELELAQERVAEQVAEIEPLHVA